MSVMNAVLVPVLVPVAADWYRYFKHYQYRYVWYSTGYRYSTARLPYTIGTGILPVPVSPHLVSRYRYW